MKRFLFLFGLVASLSVAAQTTGNYSRAESAWIHFLNPVTVLGEGQTVSGTVQIADGMNDSGKLFYGALADEIQRQLSRYPSRSAGTVDVIYYDTPSGSARNGRSGRSGRGTRSHRGSSRSSVSALNGLREFLMERLGAESVTLATVPEDWEGIVRITQMHPDIRLKPAALDIMRHVAVREGREQQLKALAGGETWQQLQQQVFPQVRRVEYKVSLVRRPVVDGSVVTLEGLYATAGSLQKGSNDYFDLIDLAARLFPESVEAAVNAAGVALLRGDVQRAAGYLQPLQKDSRANLHLGVMFLLRGDKTRSEVYLRMAEAQGMSEAVSALRALHDGNPVLSE